MAIKQHIVPITTDAAGAAVVYSGPASGMLHALVYVPGTILTGADLTIIDEVSGTALLTVTNAGTSTLTKLPRGACVNTSNVALVYAGTDPVTDRLPLVSRVQCTVAQGGDTKAGTLYVIYDEGY